MPAQATSESPTGPCEISNNRIGLMRIALDTNAALVTEAGVARYVRGLVAGLFQIAPTDMRFYECAWPVKNLDYRQPRRFLKTLYRELVWMRCIAPWLLRSQRINLIHNMAGQWITPPRGVKNVVTLHDLAVFRFPERFRRWQLLAGKRSVTGARKGDRVICISRFTADEAMQLLDLPSSKIEVIYNGCELTLPSEPPSEQRPDFDFPSEFFLFVGSLEPGKNLSLLRRAYELAAESRTYLPDLVVVGARWIGRPDEGNPPANWHYLGRQPDAVLAYLYRRAIALTFPSKYEGFGLPVVEAMSFGCPVICSRIASLPEVGGDAAYYTEMNPAAYCQSMLRLATDTSFRSNLVESGREQSKKFTWEKCAQRVLEVYRHVLS
jgi:alpha-1,3-rhamnosyl/mannosyltransferase